jgi:hypothetical protein
MRKKIATVVLDIMLITLLSPYLLLSLLSKFVSFNSKIGVF